MNAPENNSERQGSKPKRKRLYVLLIAGALIVAVLGLRQFIPTGLGGLRQILPFLFFSHERGEFTSPDGKITLTVYTNDAGAAHSGTFPSWVVREHWYGDEVVAKGCLAESRGPVPLKWTAPRSVTVAFVKGRYDDTPDPQRIGLD